jgi:hypothetical protein
VTGRVRDLLSPPVHDSVECFPRSLSKSRPLFVLHRLDRVEYDRRAVVSRNPVSGNITVIKSWSFAADQFKEGMHVFQVRQAVGSWGRDGGLPCSGFLASRQFKELCGQHGFGGIVFQKVFAADRTRKTKR